MTTGRPRHFGNCPDCNQPICSSHSPYYKCGCRGYLLRDGKLKPTRPRQKAEVKVKREVAERPFLEWWEVEELAG